MRCFGADQGAGFKFTGVASLKADGQLCLQLYSEGPGQPIAESYHCYKPPDAEYACIRKHVGKISVGEEKSIAPLAPHECH